MPMTMAQALVAEFAQEAQATRKMLERVPGDKLDWQPHEKSMTLGRLASHIADLPEWVTTITGKDETDIGGDYEPWIAASTEELVEKFDQCVASFKETLGDLSDQALLQSWTLRNGETEIFTIPKVAALRGFVMSHSFHHRGQLSVFLRLLDVPLPQVYGPTADERGGF